MNGLKLIRRNGRMSTLWLAVPVGLSLLLVGVLLSAFSEASDVQAASGTLYIDGVTGQDTDTCGTTVAPCRTISYTLHSRTGEGDTLRIAQGTYTENLTINISVTLEGGYDAATWTRDPSQYETILDGSGTPLIPGDWDGWRVRYPMVITDAGSYKMWYMGIDLDEIGRIGYATSPDGASWTRHPANPVLDVGAAGEWDEMGLQAPFVWQDGATYKMWYSGKDASGTSRIGYATSTDGVNWTEHPGNPIIDLGQEGWNNTGVRHPHVLYEGGVYKMWLLTLGDDGNGLATYIAYLTSDDGLDWTWDDANPLFGRTWEDQLWRPNLLTAGMEYQMWHSVWSNGEAHITYADSDDGLAWNKHGSPVLSGVDGEWDDNWVNNPFVLEEGGVYTMWYDNNQAIGVVTSTNGITWTRFLTGPVLTPGTPPTWGLPVADIEVVNGEATVVLDGLTITGGSGEQAGGVYAGNANVTVQHCLIHHNFANGAPNSWGAGGVISERDITIVDSRIVNNRVMEGAGGVRVGQGVLHISNSLVADNQGDAGLHLNGSAVITNVTIANNAPPGIIFNPQTGGDLQITNSIIFGNAGGDNHVPNQDDVQITYSLIQGGWTGTGNIDADPLFLNPAQGDYRLQAGSPAIDAGTNAGAPPIDLDGNPRPQDGNLNGTATADMGAYEFVPFKIYLPLTLRNFTP